MQISTDFRKILVDELRVVAKKVADHEIEIHKKIYFFSAAHAVVYRIFNMNFDPELVLIHLVLNSTHGIVQNLHTMIERGDERVIQIPDDFFDKLARLTEELAKAIEEDKNVYEILQKIAINSYSLTGNGYYLYQKGIIKV
jgi:mevalonate kinase